MNILLIFTFFIISGAVTCIDVIGYSGGSVLVDSLTSWCKDCLKSMTKLNPWRKIINDEKHYRWINKGRFTLYCNENGNLMIYIRDLNTQDSGSYRIKDQSFAFEINLSVNTDVCCKGSNTLEANIKRTAVIRCEYSQNHMNDAKTVFKEDKDSIEMIYKTNTNMWKNKKRFSIYENTYKNQISLTITDVRSEDSGVYLCGVWLYSFFILTVVHLHIMSKVGLVRASGYSAGGIIFKCRHHQYKNNIKYVCKESDGCCERTYPSVQDQWMNNGDVCLYDDTSAGVLMVYFRDLNATHAGTYRCGVNSSQYTDTFTQVQLQIKHNPVLSHWWMNKSVSVGDEVNITCQIPEEHKFSPKFFCKEDENHICQSIIRSEVKLNDFSDKSVFTVIISNVTVRDAGVYWCGAETSDFISLTTKVQLIIISKQELLLNKREGDNMSIECKHHAEYEKVFCKAHEVSMCVNDAGVSLQSIRDDGFSLSDETSTGVFTVNISHLREEHSGIYWCGSHIITKVHLNITRVSDLFNIIIISVSVLLLMKTIMLLLNLGFIRKINKLKLTDKHPSFVC